MSYQAVQTRRFARQYKKLHDNVAADVDAAVSTVETSPKIGDQKKGDLAALYVYKFRSQGQRYGVHRKVRIRNILASVLASIAILVDHRCPVAIDSHAHLDKPILSANLT